MVAFDREARGDKRVGKALAQIPVSEKNRAQAARS